MNADPPASVFLTNPVFTVFTPGPVTNLGVTISNFSDFQEVDVSWGHPVGSEDYPGLLNITNYTVTIIRTGDNQTQSQFPLGSNRVTTKFLVPTHLLFGVEYRAELEANNVVGSGPKEAVTFTPGE